MCQWHLQCSPRDITTRHVLSNANPVLCTICKRYSCQPLSRISECPAIKQCQQCLEWSCFCQGEVAMCMYCRVESCPGCDPRQLTCHGCGLNSCSKCKRMMQCKECLETSCQNCRNDLFTCFRCNDSYCDNCELGITCNICFKIICETCDEQSGLEFDYCDRCTVHMCNGCQTEAFPSPPISMCQRCGIGLCRFCLNHNNLEGTVFQKCPCCELQWCNDSYCLERCGTHDCTPPGEIVYSARNARKGDHEANLCACGKKHLSSPKGQQFMCLWLKE